ncbi:hypothetical protein HK101_002358 [Irineochytrium annulatum]|nr:hypothetical protein HK101_002358 [Irineochytrium annulatum]
MKVLSLALAAAAAGVVSVGAQVLVPVPMPPVTAPNPPPTAPTSSAPPTAVVDPSSQSPSMDSTLVQLSTSATQADLLIATALSTLSFEPIPAIVIQTNVITLTITTSASSLAFVAASATPSPTNAPAMPQPMVTGVVADTKSSTSSSTTLPIIILISLAALLLIALPAFWLLVVVPRRRKRYMDEEFDGMDWSAKEHTSSSSSTGGFKEGSLPRRGAEHEGGKIEHLMPARTRTQYRASMMMETGVGGPGVLQTRDFGTLDSRGGLSNNKSVAGSLESRGTHRHHGMQHGAGRPQDWTAGSYSGYRENMRQYDNGYGVNAGQYDPSYMQQQQMMYAQQWNDYYQYTAAQQYAYEHSSLGDHHSELGSQLSVGSTERLVKQQDYA